MKRCLSVVAPNARLTVWKVLLLSILTAGAQVSMFFAALRGWNREYGFPALELLVHDGFLFLAFGAGLVLVCAVLALPGLERGAKTGYTLRRLNLDERTVVLLWGGVNTLLLLIFWGIQTAAALALSQYYLSIAPAGAVTHQYLFLAVSCSPYLHALLPLWDWPLLVRNLLSLPTLGLSAAALSFHWRHGRKSWALLPLAVLAGFTFPCAPDAVSSSIGLFVAGLALAMTLGFLWRRYDNED